MANAPSKLETAQTLAKRHFAIEPEMRHVFLLEPVKEHDPREPIKLLEVVAGSAERGIEPVAFPPDPVQGRDCFLYIIEISPRELEKLRSGALTFAERGWEIGQELAA